MRKSLLTALLAVAALGFVAIDTAQAQYIYQSGYSQGYTPGYYGNGFQPVGGYSYGSNYYNYNSNPIYGYNSFPSYFGYNNSNFSPALRAYNSFYRRGGVGNNNYNYWRRGR